MAYKRGNRITSFGASFIPALVMFHFIMLLVRLVNWLIFRLHIEERQRLRSLKGGLLVSNHTLVLDPGIIAHTISPKRTYFTMLEETATIPLTAGPFASCSNRPRPRNRKKHNGVEDEHEDECEDEDEPKDELNPHLATRNAKPRHLKPETYYCIDRRPTIMSWSLKQ